MCIYQLIAHINNLLKFYYALQHWKIKWFFFIPKRNIGFLKCNNSDSMYPLLHYFIITLLVLCTKISLSLSLPFSLSLSFSLNLLFRPGTPLSSEESLCGPPLPQCGLMLILQLDSHIVESLLL